MRWLLIAVLLALLATCHMQRKAIGETGGSGARDGAMRAGPDPAEPEEIQWLEERLYTLGSGFDGYLGIAVRDLGRGQTVHFNGDKLFPQQSISKMWVALAALDMADSGVLNLDETGTVRYEDLTVFHQPIRKQVLASGRFTTTYRDFLKRALTESDNTANDMVLRRVGGSEVIRMMLKRQGLDDIRFGPGEREMQAQIAALEWQQSFAIGKTFFEVRKMVPHDKRKVAFDGYVTDPVDGATPDALVLALARLQLGELLSDDSTTQLLQWMREAKSGPNRLKGGVPEGWSIVHKTGTGQVLDIVPPGVIGEQAGYNDIGILTAPDGRHYAVAVMIGRTKRPVPERMDLMHKVVGAVASYHARAKGEPLPEATTEGDADATGAAPISSPRQRAAPTNPS